MVEYPIVIEPAGANYSAYSPDLPGCVATGKTRAQAKRRMAAAIRFHLEGMQAEGLKIPKPKSRVGHVEVRMKKAG